ncbi:MAG: hypothetical protein NXI31_13955 [bacterium]|nr:hypothetical protein [bacterium]
MKRVAIIGSGGSGKTTLARHLGAILRIPVHHLDGTYWRDSWSATPEDEWTEVHAELCRQPTWILDGNYGGTMAHRLAAADTVIFLDIGRWLCLWRALRRYLRFRGRNRPELPPGCHERLSVDYLAWIWSYRSRRRRRILERLEAVEPQRTIVVLTSPRAVTQFVADLARRREA